MLLNKYTSQNTQSGNVFFIILIAVALFSALAFVVTRSSQTNTVRKMTEREANLVASDVINYAKRMERAVNTVRQNGCSENDVSFENSVEAGYTHAPNVDDKCKIFLKSGGKIAWQSPPQNSNDGSLWFFGANNLKNAAGTQFIGTNTADLVMILKNVNINVCDSINKINKFDVWESDGTHNDITKFDGDYSVGVNEINKGNDWPLPTTGCFCDDTGSCTIDSPRYFYHALLIR